MSGKAREFLDFWIENSLHAVEQFRTPGASQNVSELTARCIEMAQGQGISEQDIRDEVGDPSDYIRVKLAGANRAEHHRDDGQ